MRALLLTLVLSCGGPPVEWAGKWREAPTFPPGANVECTLGGSGDTIVGSGVQHREAGTDLPFTVSGTACKVAACVAPASVTFSYQGGTTENFEFSQPDSGHITLQNPQRTVNLVRQ
jgi:hypothetical protein